jgi:hypothetical protein
LNADKKCNCGAVLAYSLAVLGGFLIVGGLVWIMYSYTRPEPLAEDRATFRRTTRDDVRRADADALDTPTVVWSDQSKGFVRLPVKQAEALALRMWQNPAAARAELNSRVEKEFFVPPPPAGKFD